MHQSASLFRISGVVRKDFEQLVSKIKTPKVPDGLFEGIMVAIQKERKLMILRKKIAMFSVGAFVSIIAFIPVLRLVSLKISESGFSQYFSLIFSDFKLVLSYWQSFSAALLESFPIINFTLLLAIVLMLLGSLKYLTKNLKAMTLAMRH